ncbi:4227_t:CDS:2, partial [Paraglomus occultum]
MDKLRQTNQELHDEIDRLAQSNRDYGNAEHTILNGYSFREERIRYLEEELANTIELSIQEREELEKEITDLKKIVYHLKKEIEQKDKELITRENQLAEFDVREKKLKTRIREISKSAGNTPKAYTQTVKLVDENERLKHEIDTLKYNLRDRDKKLAQKKTRITDLHCQNFALALLRYLDRVELINTQETLSQSNEPSGLQNAQIWNEYESDENSQDSYTSDPDMTTIIELADTIDDLINEQQRRYNAEAERDIRQTELTQTQGDLNLKLLHIIMKELYASNNGSEFGALNDATINALGWKADKPSDFDIKGNSKHITESLGWFTDVPVSIKDKDGKTVTATGNFTRIDNGEPEPMLCLGMTWIRKVQGILDPNKNQFRMKLHGYRFGSTREVELEEALRDSCKTNSELIDDFKNYLYQKVHKKFIDNIKQDNNKVHLQRNLNQTSKDKEELTKYIYQLIDEIKRLNSELDNLSSQIKRSQISNV